MFHESTFALPLPSSTGFDLNIAFVAHAHVLTIALNTHARSVTLHGAMGGCTAGHEVCATGTTFFPTDLTAPPA
jgi:hypothetical protein